VEAASTLPPGRQLAIRVSAILMGALLLGLIAIGSTLYLSWQLEGGGAAINAAGSLRMRSYQLGLSLQRYSAVRGAPLRADIVRQRQAFDTTLTLLRNGDATRPLYLPSNPDVHARFDEVERHYRSNIVARVDAVLAGAPVGDWDGMRRDLDGFVAEVDGLVLAIEQDNERHTLWLRASQMMLVALAVTGTVTQIYLMFLLVFRPLGRLRAGIARMTEQDFSVSLPVDSDDEFGEVTSGFNRMAGRLAESYATLESRVADKTAALNAHNRELALLYDIAAFLNDTQNAEAMCRGFLERVMQGFGADGGSVRTLDPANSASFLTVHSGLSPALVAAEHCLMPGDCLCSENVAGTMATLYDLRRQVPLRRPGCFEEGFLQLGVFPLRARKRQTGTFNLHFRTPRTFSARERQWLDTLGNHLGTALENVRLAARERELAVSEERGLLAQGLHDSIAQGLSFLNLQVQMLEDSLRRGQLDEGLDIVPLLQAGVQESYDDVRELLLNFRTRLQEGDLAGAMETAVDKFGQQSGVVANFESAGDGAPLPADDQLQVLFILQEALSNVRKHARAGRVDVFYEQGGDLCLLTVRDDGCGFDAAAVRPEQHVGLRIMKERAQRLGAELDWLSGADGGTLVRLLLPRRPVEGDEIA